MALLIPEKLVTVCQNQGERLSWLDRLPEIIQDLQQRWSLQLGPPFAGEEGSCAWVAPVTREDRSAAVLKLGLPHLEGEHEIAGLRFWTGNPTVHLLAADEELNALLLECCQPGTLLRALPESEQDAVLAPLLHRLWRVPPESHPFRPLSTMLAYWSQEAWTHAEHWPDPGLVQEGLHLFEELTAAAPQPVLLATDLHAGNVLRAQREPWLVIDPKPFVGDPAYDATQHLLNCQDRLRSEPEETIRRWADLLQVDAERVRLWTLARAAVQAGLSGGEKRWQDLARVLGRSR